MKGQIADKLNTEERCELKDEDFGISDLYNRQEEHNGLCWHDIC